jgi:DNA adenine methylase
MSTPISYWGGKQHMADIIIRLLPPHRLYCEPFTGGAAIFFAKKPSPVEILNDENSEITNFYEVLKNDFDTLCMEVQTSLHSRKLHKHAGVIYVNPDMFDRVKRAWAIWMLATTSFGSMLDGIWGHDVHGKKTSTFRHKRADFTKELSDRLKSTRIECCDAIKVIRDNDAADSLFYTDPPYVGSDQGHYTGYTQSDFDALLNTLAGIKGKFLLSSYPNKNLAEFVKQNAWYQFEVSMSNAMATSHTGHFILKTEVLTANYLIHKDGWGTPGLFD